MSCTTTRDRIRNLVLCALLAALTAAGAFLRVPMFPMSFSVQTLFTLLAGLLLGPRAGALSQGIYIALGLLGLPIFTEGGGLQYVLKPSFGFLLGMIACAAVTGLVYRRTRTPKGALLACMAGTAALYAVGLPYMYIILNFYLGRGADALYVLYYGCVLFLPGDALKLVFASVLGDRIRPALRMK